MERRKFLQFLGVSVVSAPFFMMKNSLSGLTTAFAEGETFAKPGEGMAKQVHYCVDADKSAKSSKSTCPERKSKEHATHYCYNCVLFDKTRGDKKAAVGKCKIMPPLYVHGNDFCNSWVLNPNA